MKISFLNFKMNIIFYFFYLNRGELLKNIFILQYFKDKSESERKYLIMFIDPKINYFKVKNNTL